MKVHDIGRPSPRVVRSLISGSASPIGVQTLPAVRISAFIRAQSAGTPVSGRDVIVDEGLREGFGNDTRGDNGQLTDVLAGRGSRA